MFEKKLKLQETTVLKNGLRVVTDYINHVETVSLGAWIGIGARHEEQEENGISHVLEHMAFKGTKKRSALEISMAIENVGGYLNAYTSRESTAYYARVLKEDFSIAVDIVADILQNSIFSPEELEKEKQVILQEIGQTLDTPDDVVFDYFQETCFPEQPIGRSILGPQENVLAFTSGQIHNYMHDHYATENIVFAAAGKIDHQHLVNEVEKGFANFKEKAVINTQPAIYKGGNFRLEKPLEQVHLLIGFEGVGIKHSDYYNQMLLATLLGGGMTSRLFQEIREKRGLVYTISSYITPYSDTGVFGIYAGTGKDQVKELMPAILSEVVHVKDSIKADELIRCKTQIKAGLLMGLESTSNRCERIANQILIHGRVIDIEEIEDRIESVNIESIQSFAQKMLDTKPTLTCLGPTKHVLDYDGFMTVFNNMKRA